MRHQMLSEGLPRDHQHIGTPGLIDTMRLRYSPYKSEDRMSRTRQGMTAAIPVVE
jgi:hypothetical protein